MENPALRQASATLKTLLSNLEHDSVIVDKARAKRIERVKLWNAGSAETASVLILRRFARSSFFCHRTLDSNYPEDRQFTGNSLAIRYRGGQMPPNSNP